MKRIKLELRREIFQGLFTAVIFSAVALAFTSTTVIAEEEAQEEISTYETFLLPDECNQDSEDEEACNLWLANKIEELQAQRSSTHQVKVLCESWDFKPEVCAFGNQLLGARLIGLESKTPCSSPKRWGTTSDAIHVFDGCRAYFSARIDSTNPVLTEIACASHGFKDKDCPVAAELEITGAWLNTRVSKSKCSRNDSWGWDEGKIWVKDGCRGIFQYTAEIR